MLETYGERSSGQRRGNNDNLTIYNEYSCRFAFVYFPSFSTIKCDIIQNVKTSPINLHS